MAIRGAIFDLDGTLVDSGLDFDQMRREMNLAPGLPLLEAIEQLPAAHAERCWAILAEHELAGARRSTLYPGVREFVHALEVRGLRRAIFTRNSRRDRARHAGTIATRLRSDSGPRRRGGKAESRGNLEDLRELETAPQRVLRHRRLPI